MTLYIPVTAGVYTRTQFTIVNDGVADSNFYAIGQGVGLAVERQATIKLFGDDIPATPTGSFYSDVICTGTNAFTLFYVDTSMVRVAAQNINLQPSGNASVGSPSTMFTISAPSDCYLHVDRGTNGYFASYNQKKNAGNTRYLQVNNGNTVKNIDSSTTTLWVYPSQCAMVNDTFLVINSVDVERVTLRKIYSRNSTLSVIDETTVTTGVRGTATSVLNCSVAADSNGMILAAWLRGGPSTDKYLNYTIYSSNLVAGPTDSYAQPVSATSDFYYYDDVPVVSYGPGRFALASWDGSGVLLHLVETDGVSTNMTTSRIIGKAGVKFCSIAANNRRLVVACIGDVDGNGVAAVEGVVFPIENYLLGTPDTVSFSDQSTAIITYDAFSTAINSAIDDSGTVILTWRHNTTVYGCVWAKRGIRYEKGFYRSPIESLTTVPDSVVFSPAQIALSSTTSWYTEAFIRLGSTSAECLAAPWVSLTDQGVLQNNRRKQGYFQYRIYLNRLLTGTIDSLTTPELTGITIPWNTQPHLVAMDSIQIGSIVKRTVAFGDTVELLARCDTARVSLHGYDWDNGDAVTLGISLGTPTTETFSSGGPEYYFRSAINPIASSDVTFACTLSVRDAAGWNGRREVLYCRTRNSLPRLSALLVRNSHDSISVTTDTAISLQQEDSLKIIYSVADSNDMGTVKGFIAQKTDGGLIKIDSIIGSSQSRFTLIADTVTPTDTVRLQIMTADPDTTVTVHCGVVVNHVPQCKTLVSGPDTLSNGDTLNVVLNDTVSFSISVDDTDYAFGDTLHYTYRLSSKSVTTTATQVTATLKCFPETGDTLVWFRINDRFGRTDSMFIHLAYPWYETDSLKNPGYNNAKRELANGLSLIAESSKGDTVRIPLKNSGRNNYYLTGCSLPSGSDTWVKVKVVYGNESFMIDAANDSFPGEVPVYPDSTIELMVLFSSENLVGDSVLCDTMIVMTDDPRHRNDPFIICMEYNDLPRIVSVHPDFIADRPYRPVAKRMNYHFPPHASIAISFSEPMDSSTAMNGLQLYSVFDSAHTGSVEAIPIQQTWMQNYTVVHLSPRYTSPSPSFNRQPAAGLFIPTDSLGLVLTSALTDRAQTPSGPNALDVNMDHRRDSGDDTTLTMRVDSIDFTVLAIEPEPGDTTLSRSSTITLTFSSPVYATSVDTSLIGNRTLVVTSEYSDTDTLTFSSVHIESTSVAFGIARELFYRDRVHCYYNSRWICDRLGFATDNDGDGIDATMFDTSARDDDIQWDYRVLPVAVVSVDPADGTELTAVSPLITLTFTGSIPAGVIDTDTSLNNHSLKVGSTRTGWSPFRLIRFSDDSMSVTVQPRKTFFSNDSVYCQFTGFSGNYRYQAETNLPLDTTAIFGGYEWSFRSGEIGFYTYPNPYKPGSDPRHCRDNGPCGIWFKNLHTLADNCTEVRVTIFSMTAHQIFSSQKAGITIRFDDDDLLPQWLWDTRNNKGDPVATGIYLYAVYRVDGTILQKGKLVIVR